MNLAVVDCMADPSNNFAWIRQGNAFTFSSLFIPAAIRAKEERRSKRKCEQIMVLLIPHFYCAGTRLFYVTLLTSGEI